MLSDPRQILCSRDDPSIYKKFLIHQRTVQRPDVTLEGELESGDEGHPYRLTPAPDVLPFLPELLNHPLFRANIKKIAEVKIRRIQAFEMDKSLIKATEEAISYAFQIGCFRRSVRTKFREFCQASYVHGRFHNSRPGIASFWTPRRKVYLPQNEKSNEL